MMTLEDILNRTQGLTAPGVGAPPWETPPSLQEVCDMVSWIGQWAIEERSKQERSMRRQSELIIITDCIKDFMLYLASNTPIQVECSAIIQRLNDASDQQVSVWAEESVRITPGPLTLQRFSQQLSLLLKINHDLFDPPRLSEASVLGESSGDLSILRRDSSVSPPSSAEPPVGINNDATMIGPTAENSHSRLLPEAKRDTDSHQHQKIVKQQCLPSAEIKIRIKELKNEIPSDWKIESAESGGRWAVDFGTARSKVAFRETQDRCDERLHEELIFPSIIAYKGDEILFGDAAQQKAGQIGWVLVTSLKLLLVGKKIGKQGFPDTMTTERLVVAFLAWLLHSIHSHMSPHESPLKSPLRGNVNLSHPLPFGVGNETTKSLKSLFESTTALCYTDWMKTHFELARRVAITFDGYSWPKSWNDLFMVIRSWEQEKIESPMGRPNTCSEPSARMLELDANSLEEGVYVFIDCGAGTTDVCSFLVEKQGAALKPTRIVHEISRELGGDRIDEAIFSVVREKLISKNEPPTSVEEGHIRLWAREKAKVTLLTFGPVDFDPVAELERSNGMSFKVGRKDIEHALSTLQQELEHLLRHALGELNRTLPELRAIPGSSRHPNKFSIKYVYLAGGSARLQQLKDAAAKVIDEHKMGGEIVTPPKPATFSGWSDEIYQVQAVALGTAREDILQIQKSMKHPNFSDYDESNTK